MAVLSAGAVKVDIEANSQNLVKGFQMATKAMSSFGRGTKETSSRSKSLQDRLKSLERQKSTLVRRMRDLSAAGKKNSTQFANLSNRSADLSDKIATQNLKIKEFNNKVRKAPFYMQKMYAATHILANAVGAVLANAFMKATSAAVNLVKESSQMAAEYEKTMTTIEIIAPRFGVNVEEMKQSAKALGRELRIGPTAAAEGLQNLLKSGLNLDQSKDLLKRFTNEAITGKSESISLEKAVQNLTFAYMTGNSALGNMSGISENFTDVQKDGLKILQKNGKLLGLTVGQLDEGQKKQAQYAGMIALTNLTLGSSKKLQNGFIDNEARISYYLQETQRVLGSFINKAMLPFQRILIDLAETWLPKLEPALSSFTDFITKNKDEILNVFGSIATAVLLVALPALVKLAAGAVAAAAPIIAAVALIAGAIYALKLAWDKNLGGIQDKTRAVISYITEVIWPELVDAFEWFKDNILPPLQRQLARFGDYFTTELAPIISSFIDAYWNHLVKSFKWFRDNILPPLRRGLARFGDYFINVLAPIISTFIKKYWDHLVDAFDYFVTNVWPLLKEAIKGIWTQIEENLFPALLDLWEVIVTKWLPAMAALRDLIVDKVLPALIAIWDFVAPILGPALAILAGIIGFVIVGAIKIAIAAITFMIKAFTWYYEVVAWVVSGAVGYWYTFVRGFEYVKARIVSAVQSIINKYNELKNNVQQVVGYVIGLFRRLEGQVRRIAGIIAGKFNELTGNIRQSFSGIRNINLYQVGVQIIRGLINGMSSMAGAVASKAREIANQATSTIKGALQIRSPSKVFEQIGQWTGQGFVQGMDRTVPDVGEASQQLAIASIPKIDTTSNVNNVSQNNSFNISADQDLQRVVDRILQVLARKNNLALAGLNN